MFFRRKKTAEAPPTPVSPPAPVQQQESPLNDVVPNRRGELDAIGRRHVAQSTAHTSGGVLLVGVWYAALRHMEYLGAPDFWRDEYVVAFHAWILSAVVAYVHKRQSGG